MTIENIDLLKTLIDGHATLRYASENGYDAVVQMLLNAKANVHADDDEGLRIARTYL